MLLGENVRVVAALLAKRLRIAREELERTRSDPADHNDPTQLQNRPILTNDGRLRGQDTSQGQ
jgi:hypothetical protein